MSTCNSSCKCHALSNSVLTSKNSFSFQLSCDVPRSLLTKDFLIKSTQEFYEKGIVIFKMQVEKVKLRVMNLLHNIGLVLHVGISK